MKKFLFWVYLLLVALFVWQMIEHGAWYPGK
jgi:hypothetical protein